MTSQRQYMGTIVINPKTKLGEGQNKEEKCFSAQIYCIGGKSKLCVMYKTIEKYIVYLNKWQEIKT